MPVQEACVRIALRLKLFHILVEGPGRAFSLVELAEETGADQDFLGTLPKSVALC